MKVQAIVPAAGEGRRFSKRKDKPLVLLKGKPLFIYPLLVMEGCPFIDSVIVVAQENNIKRFKELVGKFALTKVKKIVAGGDRRCDSVKNALACLDQDTRGVLIHDGVRPFLTSALMEKALMGMRQEKAVVVAVPVKPTIKKVDPKNLYVQETLVRDTLWEIQTPQVFHKDLLEEAYQKMLCCEPRKEVLASPLRGDPTDDAVLVEKLGVRVKVVMGDYQNIKITTPEDLKWAETFLK